LKEDVAGPIAASAIDADHLIDRKGLQMAQKRREPFLFIQERNDH
jgi:hypothetical protein